MEIGIGLPNAVRGVLGPALIDFAREAEQAGFSSLGTIDRIVYDNYESLIALAAAAAVTERICLLTSILIAPLRSNTALLAKQAASVDGLSGGRLVLGIAPGGREDDYEVSGIDFHARGKFFDRQLDEPAPAALEALVEKYAAYRERPPAGPFLRLVPERFLYWTAT